jgi:TonB-dependent receptor
MIVSADRRTLLAGRMLIGASLAAMAIAVAQPAFAQATSGALVATPQDTSDRDDDIVITGQRASDAASLQKKRNSDVTSEVVSANDVGKLPDQNVAESVRRLSGVSVATDKGEGRYLIIRGIEPNLANVTINNQTASAPEPTDRNVKLDDIPSGLIGSVTVIKTLTPDLDANAIAGQVDIDTVSAFDKKALFASARAIVGMYQDTHRTAREGDASIGGTFGDRKFGLVVAGNYSKRPSYSEDVLSNGRQTVGGIDLPIEMDQRVYDPAIRTRKGAVVNFDYRPNDNIKLYTRFLYSQFGDNESRDRFRLFFPTAAAGYTGLTAAGGTINNGTTARRLFRQREEVTNTKTYSMGGEFDLGGVKLVIEGTHADSAKKDPTRNEFDFRASAARGVGATFTAGDGLLDSFVVNAAGLNGANYTLNNFLEVSRRAGEKLDQLRIDLTIPFDGLGQDSSFKVGAKYLRRNRFQDQTGRQFTSPTGIAAAQTLAGFFAQEVPTTFDGAYSYGPKMNYNNALAFVRANPGLFTVNATDQISRSTGSDYRVKETVTAAYAMATIKIGDLTLIPGARVEHTKGNTAAIIFAPGVTTLNSTFNSFGEYSYTDVFPGVNAKYLITDRLQARAAITTAIGRPPFVNLAPTVTIDNAANGTVALGNPTLKPQKALNLDAGLEYYFRGEGGISVAVFYKRIRNPIFNTTALNQNGTFGGIAVTNATVTSSTNGDRATLKGIEFAIQKPLTFLPSPLDGFGVNANLTLTDSNLKVPGRQVRTPLVGQAKTIASVQLYYEKYGVSARLAYTYRSAYLDTDGGLNTSTFVAGSTTVYSDSNDGYFGKLSTLDARFALRPVKNLELFFEGTNLTDAQDYYYFRTPSRFREGEKYGRSFRAGVTLTY